MWDTVDVLKWNSALSSYPAAISLREKDQNKTDLAQLEKFVFSELPAALKSRDPPHITKEEYVKLVKWKLKRGKWRPRLQKFADEIEEDAVREASTAAFSLLEKKEVKKALQKLVALKGCGPATASVILSVVDPSLPFMSDELMVAALGQANKYTVKLYFELMDAVHKKISELSSEDSTREWTALEIEKAIFANYHNAPTTNGFHKDTPKSEAKNKPSKALQRDADVDVDVDADADADADAVVDQEKKDVIDEKAEASQELKKKSVSTKSQKASFKRKAAEETPKEAIEVNIKIQPSSIRRSKRTRRQPK